METKAKSFFERAMEVAVGMSIAVVILTPIVASFAGPLVARFQPQAQPAFGS